MRRRTALALVLALISSPATALRAEGPALHERIDQLVAAATPDFAKLAAPLASDEEFLRRIYLDLTGSIPTSAEARAFLADAAPDKRAKLIDKLLESPEFSRHMQRWFDVTVMERRPEKHVPNTEWQTYLRQSFAEKKPLATLVAEILTADGGDPKLRPAAKFFLDREGESHLITRDIGRLFLGMNLQCAQCHDHPRVDDYLQEEYYGIFAFVSRSFVFTDKEKKAFVAEKADGDVTFVSVFDPEKKQHATGPRLPADAAIAEPQVEAGKEYAVKPADGVRPVPTHSRRGLLAAALPTATNTFFKRNLGNRLWALMMGRGIVHPLDLMHDDNPPSHPELLALLGDELAAMQFDVRTFLRELAMSQTYQRSCAPPEDVSPGDLPATSFAAALLKPLLAEHLALAMMQATGLTDAERKALGEQCNEQALYDKLAGNVAAFVGIFGSAAGVPEEGLQPTMNQALFLANGDLVRGWLAPRDGNLTDRLMKLPGDELADELYLSVLTRRPTAEERTELADYLKARGDAEKLPALQEVAWALLTSAEFRFCH